MESGNAGMRSGIVAEPPSGKGSVIPTAAGWTIVVVKHLRRVHTTLPEILSRANFMPAQLITEDMSVERNNICVIPRNCDLTLRDAHFRLNPVSKPQGWPNTITIFLNSLAENWAGLRVAVILSGVDSDGAAALRTIKAAGGITFAQKPETAVHPEMLATPSKPAM
ncbi:MAG: chemotaxis protein CheB [Bryobacteraceae bacterium]